MPPDERKTLRHVRAAQLRAKALRGAIVQLALGMLFLLGAFSHALGPDPHARASVLWAAALIVLSTLEIALGLRTFARARRWRGRAHWAVVIAWGALATVVLRLLARR